MVVIGLGGLIRIYDAGESCPDWPLCFGTFGFDISEEEQEAWYIENPDEVDSRGSGHRYTTFQIFTEWLHRILAGLVLGPLVILNWYMLRGSEEKVKFASTLTVVLIVWQGGIGWLTVEMDNLHWSVALHLSSALAFTMSMFWLWLTLTSSTTPGANFGCGVDGLPDSWPLCNGKIIDSVEDVVAQSQIIHRWFVGLMLIALIFASYSISNEQSGNNVLRNWIWGSTFFFFVNTSIGAIYVLSWDLEEGFFEFLSLVHLMMASLTFVTMAISWIGCSIAEDG